MDPQWRNKREPGQPLAIDVKTCGKVATTGHQQVSLSLLRGHKPRTCNVVATGHDQGYSEGPRSPTCDAVMALRKTFERKLPTLLHRRTDRLVGLVKPKRGPRKDFTKRHREKGIAELQKLAEQILRKEVVPGRLKAITAGTRRTMLGGRGLEERLKRMCAWAEQHLHGPIIYSFWRGKRCLYVGKGGSWQRLRAYRRDILLQQATSLRVRMVAGKSHVAMAECMSIHMHDPKHNINQSSKPKYSKRCPICKTNREIRDELRALFRMK